MDISDKRPDRRIINKNNRRNFGDNDTNGMVKKRYFIFAFFKEVCLLQFSYVSIQTQTSIYIIGHLGP